MPFEFGQGDESGKVWTMTGETTGLSGKPMVKRAVITWIDEEHHSMEMYFQNPNGETKEKEIQY